MENTSIIVNTAVTPGKIDFNLEEIKSAVDYISNYYGNMVYEEDPDKQKEIMSLMKDDRTKLSKAKDLLETKRIAAKKEYLLPLDAFEKEIKEMVATLDVTRSVIDKKVKEFEEKEKEIKRVAIRNLYDSMAVNVPDDYKETFYQKIYNSSWENVSSTKKAYVDGITEAIQKFEAGMETLKGFTKYQSEGIEFFKMSLDIAGAINKINALIKNEEEIIARAKERMEADARKKADEELKAKEDAIRAEERRKIQEQRASESSKSAITELSTGSAPTIIAEQQTLTFPTSSVSEKVIGIRILAGAVMEVYGPQGYNVIILDEDTADSNEIMEFCDRMSSQNEIY